MTTDNFTEAAAAAAEEQWTRDLAPGQPLRGPRRMDRRIGFTMGAAWARTHLAAQEPTDAECIAVLNAVTTPFGEKPGRTEWAPAAIRRCREAMVSARAARRDEENR